MTRSSPATERVALQKRMKELGHPVNDFDGRIDFDLRDEIRLEQAKHGIVPDGHPTRELMEKIGAKPIDLILRSAQRVSKDGEARSVPPSFETHASRLLRMRSGPSAAPAPRPS